VKKIIIKFKSNPPSLPPYEGRDAIYFPLDKGGLRGVALLIKLNRKPS